MLGHGPEHEILLTEQIMVSGGLIHTLRVMFCKKDDKVTMNGHTMNSKNAEYVISVWSE